jgi:hypothetical protein
MISWTRCGDNQTLIMESTHRLIIGPVQNLHDARYAAAVGIHALVFDTTGPYGHSLEEVKQIRDWLSGPSLLIRFGDESTEQIQTWVDALQPTAILLPTAKPITGTSTLLGKPDAAGTPASYRGGSTDWASLEVLDSPDQYDPSQPTAWWLGAFSLTEEGLLDYEACDAFLQAHSVTL